MAHTICVPCDDADVRVVEMSGGSMEFQEVVRDPIGVVAIGRRDPGERPVGSAVTRSRRPLDEVVHRSTFRPRKEADGPTDAAG
jgi:hypothetical protein